MEKLLIINPNSSIRMTADIKFTLQEQNDIEVVRMEKAPEVLESFADYTLAGCEVLNFLESIDLKNYSGVLLACFGYPCLYALKEKCAIPVIGIAEAAFSRALLEGYKFSVVAASDKASKMMESMIDLYGLQQRNAGTISLATDIVSFMGNADFLSDKMHEALRQIKKVGADSVILGCAGMTMLNVSRLSEEWGLTIIDPILTGVSSLRAMINDGQNISKAGLYS